MLRLLISNIIKATMSSDVTHERWMPELVPFKHRFPVGQGPGRWVKGVLGRTVHDLRSRVGGLL